MKTSKIIFTSYFSLLGLVLVGLLICGFVFNHKPKTGSFSNNNIKEERINLNNFQHIKIEPNCKITVIKDTANFISYHILKDSVLINPQVDYSEDTLIIKTTRNNLNNNISIHVAKDISVSGTNCTVELKEFVQQQLKVNLSNSRFRLAQNSSIDNFDLTLVNNSRFNHWDGKINNLDLTLQNSKFENGYRIHLNKLNAKIYNNSNAYLPTALECNIKRDNSSKVRIN